MGTPFFLCSNNIYIHKLLKEITNEKNAWKVDRV